MVQSQTVYGLKGNALVLPRSASDYRVIRSGKHCYYRYGRIKERITGTGPYPVAESCSKCKPECCNSSYCCFSTTSLAQVSWSCTPKPDCDCRCVGIESGSLTLPYYKCATWGTHSEGETCGPAQRIYSCVCPPSPPNEPATYYQFAYVSYVNGVWSFFWELGNYIIDPFTGETHCEIWGPLIGVNIEGGNCCGVSGSGLTGAGPLMPCGNPELDQQWMSVSIKIVGNECCKDVQPEYSGCSDESLPSCPCREHAPVGCGNICPPITPAPPPP